MPVILPTTANKILESFGKRCKKFPINTLNERKVDTYPNKGTSVFIYIRNHWPQALLSAKTLQSIMCLMSMN